MALTTFTQQQLRTVAKTTGAPSFKQEMRERFKDHEKKIQETHNLTVLGFLVLLLMLATIIISVFLDYKHSADQVRNDQYELLKDKIDFLEEKVAEKVTITPTVTPTPDH